MLKDVRVTPGRMRGQPEGEAEGKAHLCLRAKCGEQEERPLHALGPSHQEPSQASSECVWAVCSVVPTLCNPTDCSPPGSSVHGILQARILEGVAISFSTSFESSYKIKQRKTALHCVFPFRSPIK